MDLSSSVTLTFNFFHDDPKRYEGGIHIQVLFPAVIWEDIIIQQRNFNSSIRYYRLDAVYHFVQLFPSIYP